jgi:hypothetical protein
MAMHEDGRADDDAAHAARDGAERHLLDLAPRGGGKPGCPGKRSSTGSGPVAPSTPVAVVTISVLPVSAKTSATASIAARSSATAAAKSPPCPKAVWISASPAAAAGGEASRVGEVAPHRLDPERGEPRGAGLGPDEAADPVPAGEEACGDPPAEVPRGAGEEDLHRVLRRVLTVRRCTS